MSQMYSKYLVLNPNKDDIKGHASRLAVLAYADAVYKEDSALAFELRSWIDSIKRKLLEQSGEGLG